MHVPDSNNYVFAVCVVCCALVQVYDAFAELVAAKVNELRVGDGMAADTTHGPLITPAGVEKVRHTCTQMQQHPGLCCMHGVLHTQTHRPCR
jgi:acyl-CoA reductase-like NAD-dependent aldehyde dehydrogenase